MPEDCMQLTQGFQNQSHAPHITPQHRSRQLKAMQDALRSQLDLRRDGLAPDVEELAAAIQGSAREVSYSPEQSVYEVAPFSQPSGHSMADHTHTAAPICYHLMSLHI